MVSFTAATKSDEKENNAFQKTPFPTMMPAQRPRLGSNDSSNANLFECLVDGSFVEDKEYMEGKRVRNDDDIMTMDTQQQQQPPAKKFAAVRRCETIHFSAGAHARRSSIHT